MVCKFSVRCGKKDKDIYCEGEALNWLSYGLPPCFELKEISLKEK